MEEYEQQPDSTTTHEGGDVPVTNDLVNLSEETSEAVPAATTMFLESRVKDKEPEDEPKPEPKPEKNQENVATPAAECTASDGGCLVCHFISYLGKATPEPVYDVFVWKDVYKSAVIFFTVLPLLILYCYCNPIVVTAYLLLGLVTSTFTYRLYRYVLDSFQKSEVQNPFIGFSDIEVSSSRQVIMEWVDFVLPHFVRCFNKLKHYLLVYDLVDTVKFAVLLYVIAVIGGYFSLRILLILGFVATFTLPRVYSIYRVQITDTLQKTSKIVRAALKEAREKVKNFKLSKLTAKAKQN